MSNPIMISELTIENLEGFIYPVLHIKNENNENERFLMPFRLYRFQICETIDGECDMGSSEVKKFSDILQYSLDPRSILMKYLCMCLNDYMSTSYGYPGRIVRYTYQNNIFRNEYREEKDLRNKVEIKETYKIEDLPFVDEFIDETIAAVKREYKI